MNVVGCLIVFVLLASTAMAQTPTTGERKVIFDFTAKGFVSFQEGTGENLSFGLGIDFARTMFGAGIEGGIGQEDGFMVGFDISKTQEFSASAGGRAVGPATLHATHRNYVVSVLPGWRLSHAAGAFEVKAGIGLVFGEWSFQEIPIDVAKRIAFAGSVAQVWRISPRGSLVTSVSYIRMFEGSRASTFGLGEHVFRPSVGVRVRF